MVARDEQLVKILKEFTEKNPVIKWGGNFKNEEVREKEINHFQLNREKVQRSLEEPKKETSQVDFDLDKLSGAIARAIAMNGGQKGATEIIVRFENVPISMNEAIANAHIGIS
jgi:hypothetical protein